MTKLPTTINLNESEIIELFINENDISDILSNFLSDKYGFCHKGFDFEIKIKNIKWDKSN